MDHTESEEFNQMIPPVLPDEVMTMDLNALGKACYANAASKGFWDANQLAIEFAKDHGFSPELIKEIEIAFNAKRLMEVTSELGEALEAQRNGKVNRVSLTLYWLVKNPYPSHDDIADNPEVRDKWIKEFMRNFEENVKDTKEDEMADALIRAFQNMHGENIDISLQVKLKMIYNSFRPHRNGKKYG